MADDLNTGPEVLKIVDSHTGGEPTRVVIEGFPDLGAGSVRERLKVFQNTHDNLRTGIINEPRGHSAIVGALLCEPENVESDLGVIFFNNEGYLGMCGHGTIGVVKTLEYLGQLKSRVVKLDTVAGTVEALINTNGTVSVKNVESYRYRKDVEISLQNGQKVIGDVAWGGNWFFLVKNLDFEVSMANLDDLSSLAEEIMQSLSNQDVTGANNGIIDHVELFGETKNADSKNFVMCPGGEYDRSPCGTGTSAKVACLAADGLLAEGDVWVQESVTGSVFEAKYASTENGVIPTITGSAYITGETTLVFDESDPFRHGIK